MAYYYTIDHLSEGQYKEKGSKFIAYAFPVENEDLFKDQLSDIKKEHSKARHHCYAYCIGFQQNKIERSNDDGEPSGTAGRPILGQLEKNKLDNIGLVVVRYFGGTKLGVSGLIQAYKKAAEDALLNAKIIKTYIKRKCTIAFSYESLGILMQAIKDLNISIENTEFDQRPVIIIEEEATRLNEKIIAIKAKLLNRSSNDVSLKTEIKGIHFTIGD